MVYKFLGALFAVFFTASCATFPLPANAQARAPTACGVGSEMRDSLWEDYHEALRGWGLTTNYKLFQLFFRHDEDNTWTAMQVSPDNAALSCVLAVGTNGTAFPLDTEMQPDAEGRVLAWRGLSLNERTGLGSVFEIFVLKTDNSWIVKRTDMKKSTVKIMATGTEWNVLPDPEVPFKGKAA